MTETMIGIVFFVNTVVIVLAQLPVTKLTEGHRRMRTLAILGVLWASCWVLVPLAGAWVTGVAAAVLLAGIMAAFGIGECLHGSVQGAARRRPRRAVPDGPLHGALRALVAGRVRARAGDRGLRAGRQPQRRLVRGRRCSVSCASAWSLSLERSLPTGARSNPVPEPA